MSIVVRCRRCGTEFVPTREAIVRGAWRLCPACRDPTPPGAAAGPSPDPRPGAPYPGAA